jgi:hypothetical protein
MQRIGWIVLAYGLVCFGMADAHGQPQSPNMDRSVNGFLQALPSWSCRDLRAQFTHSPIIREEGDPDFIRALHQDAQVRQAFIDRVAVPVANKLFECDLIPFKRR